MDYDMIVLHSTGGYGGRGEFRERIDRDESKTHT
jgi:hypothetical protein